MWRRRGTRSQVAIRRVGEARGVVSGSLRHGGRGHFVAFPCDDIIFALVWHIMREAESWRSWYGIHHGHGSCVRPTAISRGRDSAEKETTRTKADDSMQAAMVEGESANWSD